MMVGFDIRFMGGGLDARFDHRFRTFHSMCSFIRSSLLVLLFLYSLILCVLYVVLSAMRHP
jgi:uncharacterized membrane protein YagU involved in acid resistance